MSEYNMSNIRNRSLLEGMVRVHELSIKEMQALGILNVTKTGGIRVRDGNAFLTGEEKTQLEELRARHEADLEAVAHWYHSDGTELTQEDREIAADGLEIARAECRQFLLEHAPRTETKQREPDGEYPTPEGASARVRSNRRIENRMIEIVEQILEGEEDA